MGLNMNEYCLVDVLKSKVILSVLGEECRFLKHENISVPKRKSSNAQLFLGTTPKTVSAYLLIDKCLRVPHLGDYSGKTDCEIFHIILYISGIGIRRFGQEML